MTPSRTGRWRRHHAGGTVGSIGSVVVWNTTKRGAPPARSTSTSREVEVPAGKLFNKTAKQQNEKSGGWSGGGCGSYPTNTRAKRKVEQKGDNAIKERGNTKQIKTILKWIANAIVFYVQ